MLKEIRADVDDLSARVANEPRAPRAKAYALRGLAALAVKLAASEKKASKKKRDETGSGGGFG